MRTPLIKLPRSCYAAEFTPEDLTCVACPHQAGCCAASRSRQSVPLRELKASFKSPFVKAPRLESSFADDYARAYECVFGTKADSITRFTDMGAKVTALAKDTGCSRELFIYAVMAAHKSGSPDRRFYAGQLVGPTAAKRVELYREAAARRYGVFDYAAIANLTGDASANAVDEQVCDAEKTVGVWIVRQVMRGVTGEIQGALYEQRELGLSPLWAATDASYLSWAVKQPATPAMAKHRAEVYRLAGSQSLIRTRERLFARAAVSVCDAIDSRMLLFRCSPVITDPMSFWVHLGQAAQRLQLLNMLAAGQATDSPRASITVD